jgi:hypothetical protein
MAILSRSQVLSKEVVLVARPRVTFTLDQDVFGILRSRIPEKERSKIVNEALRQYLAIHYPQDPLKDDDPPPVEDTPPIDEATRIEWAHALFTQNKGVGTIH